MSPWIEHIKMMAHKLGCSYKEAMMNPQTKATYRMHMTKHGGKLNLKDAFEYAKPHIMPYVRKVASHYLTGGAHKMTVKHLRHMCKMAGHKLSRDGKPLKKNELMSLLHSEGGVMSGGIHRMKKANKWLDFSKRAAETGIDLGSKGYAAYKAATGGVMSGGVHRMKKANKWLDFSKRAAETGIDLGSKGYAAYKAATGGRVRHHHHY
jgi:hypothetical protein